MIFRLANYNHQDLKNIEVFFIQFAKVQFHQKYNF